VVRPSPRRPAGNRPITGSQEAAGARPPPRSRLPAGRNAAAAALGGAETPLTGRKTAAGVQPLAPRAALVLNPAFFILFHYGPGRLHA
jgi:hypothetical protein